MDDNIRVAESHMSDKGYELSTRPKCLDIKKKYAQHCVSHVHKKRGPFCSRSCGNARIHTKAHIEVLSQKAKANHAAGIHQEHTENFVAVLKHARKKALNPLDTDLQELNYEDLLVPPVVKTLPDGKFVQDGDIWTENDW
jgi:hypothetical protein